MLFLQCATLIAILLKTLGFGAGATHPNTTTVNLRIESESTTVYEGPITSWPRTIKLKSSPDSAPCNGLGAGVPQVPGDCCLDALDQAAIQQGFTYDGVFDGEFNDWAVNEIAGVSSFDNSTSLAWGLLWNWQVPNFGEGLTLSGCQQEIQDGDEVLYAYAIYDGDGREAGVYLKVSPATVTAKVGGSVTFTVIDGVSGKPAPNATIHGAPANAEGKITVNYPTAGYFPFKAKQEGAVRSNLVKVTVTK